MNFFEEDILEQANRNINNVFRELTNRNLKEERRVKDLLWIVSQTMHLAILEMYKIPVKKNKKREQ